LARGCFVKLLSLQEETAVYANVSPSIDVRLLRTAYLLLAGSPACLTDLLKTDSYRLIPRGAS
jgi:hypothetical protein